MESPVSPGRSVQSRSSGYLADMSSVSRSSSGGQRRSVTRRSRLTEQQQNVEPISTTTAAECSTAANGIAGMVVSSAHTTDSQSAGQRRSSSSLSVLGSAVRQRSGSSLFSDVDSGMMFHRTSAASTDRQSTSSNERTSLFRLPFPKPANRRSSSMSTTPSVHSPPQRTSRFDFCPTSF